MRYSASHCSFASINSQGAVGLTGVTQRKEYEFAICGTYAATTDIVQLRSASEARVFLAQLRHRTVHPPNVHPR